MNDTQKQPKRFSHWDLCRKFMDLCYEKGWRASHQRDGQPPRVAGNWSFDNAIKEAREWAMANEPLLLISFEEGTLEV